MFGPNMCTLLLNDLHFNKSKFCVGKTHLEKAVQHCLCLLDLALQKEVTFMDILRQSQTSLLVSPLEQLLQGVSAQSRRADHITNIAR